MMSKLVAALAFAVSCRSAISSSCVQTPGVHIDASGSGFSGTMCDYLESLNSEFDRAVAGTYQVSATTEKSEVLTGSAEGSSQTTFIFRSTFDENEVDFSKVEDIFDNGAFSLLLDPTYLPGKAKSYPERKVSDAFGALDVNLESTEFSLFQVEQEALAAIFSGVINRELLQIKSQYETEEGCTVIGIPSVTNEWVNRNFPLFLRPFFVSFAGFRIRARNLYPSGDRICKKDGKVTVEHMITTDIGGLLIGALYETSLFDQQQVDAYKAEAVCLEKYLLGNDAPCDPSIASRQATYVPGSDFRRRALRSGDN